MRTVITRGGAAALFGIVIAGPLGAQGGGASAGVIQMTQRDSTVFIRVAPSKAKIDSVMMLMRELDSEPLGSPAAAALRRRIDALLPMPKQATIVLKQGATPAFPLGWIGFTAQGPSNETISGDGDYIQYFAYPAIIAVDPDSPAQKAGIEPGDVLVAYNGLDVRGREFNLTQLLVPERKIAVTVRRDGDTKDFAMTAVRAPENVARRRVEFRAMPSGTELHIERTGPPGNGSARGQEPFAGMVMAGPLMTRGGGGMVISPRSMLFSPNGAFGAILSSVNPELAKTLKLEPGVLVNDVTDDTPASRAGLHTGDVIVTAAGQSVMTLKALQDIVRAHIAEQAVALKVVRDRKPRTVTVSW